MNDHISSAITTISEKLREQPRSKLNSIARRFIISDPHKLSQEAIFAEIMKNISKLVKTKYNTYTGSEFKATINKLLEGLIHEEIEPFSEESIENFDDAEEIPAPKAKQVKLTDIKRCICNFQNLGLNAMLVKCSNNSCENRFHIKCIQWKRDKSKPFLCPKCVILTNDPGFKPLNTLIEPTILQNGDVYDFMINYKDFKDLESKTDKSIGIEIRCLKLDGKGIYLQSWPDSGSMKIGNQTIAKFKPLHQNSALKKRKDEKFFGRQIFKLGMNTISFTYENVCDGKNSEVSSTPKYLFTVLLVKRLSIEELCKQILEENSLSIEESQQFLKNRFLQQKDLEISEIKADLKCKLSLTLLKHPARGRDCKHIDCFNLENFLQTMESSRIRKWQCPLCKKWCSDIIVDTYLDEIVQEAKMILPENPDKVTFYQNGTYKFNTEYEGNRNPLEDYAVTHEQQVILDVLSDGSDDQNKENKKTNFKTKSARSLSGEEIDITIDENVKSYLRKRNEPLPPSGTLKINQNFRQDNDFLKNIYLHFLKKNKKPRFTLWDSKNVKKFNTWKNNFFELCSKDVLFSKKVTLLYKVILNRRNGSKSSTEQRYKRIIENYSKPTWAFANFSKNEQITHSRSKNQKPIHVDRETALLDQLIEDYFRQNLEDSEPDLPVVKTIKPSLELVDLLQFLNKQLSKYLKQYLMDKVLNHQPPPKSFYDLEMQNPKRHTGFATIGKHLMNVATTGQQKHLFEGNMIKEEEQRNEEEFNYYRGLMDQAIKNEKSKLRDYEGDHNIIQEASKLNEPSRQGIKTQFQEYQPDHIDQFNRALDNFIYDKDDNDLNRRANKAHNLRGNLKFVGTGHPAGNKEVDTYKKVQKQMVYRTMLDEQKKIKSARDAREREIKKEEDRIELEKIERMNKILELRKIEEDRKMKEKLNGVKVSNIMAVETKKSANEQKFKDYQVHVDQKVGNKYNQLSTIDEDVRGEMVQNEIKKSIDIARNDMIYEKNRIRMELEEELAKEKQFLSDLPDEIRRKIQATMELELHRLKNEVNHGTNVLRDEILRMRSMAVELDEEKRKAKEDLQVLRTNLAKIQYQDDIRTHELLDALAEQNLNKLLPSSSKFHMPEALFTDEPKNRFPISYYDEHRLIKGEKKLYTDGYFAQEADNEVPLYKSLNFYDRKSRRNGDFFRGSADKIFERNNERDHVYGSMLTEKPLYELEDYIRRDLADPLELSF